MPVRFLAREGTRSRTRPGIQCAVWTGPVRNIGISVRRRDLFFPNSPAIRNPVRMCILAPTYRGRFSPELYAGWAIGNDPEIWSLPPRSYANRHGTSDRHGFLPELPCVVKAPL